ncbi:MAG: hypothetical protein QXZ17_05730, partial [Nitrososphaerota archaeon]
ILPGRRLPGGGNRLAGIGWEKGRQAVPSAGRLLFLFALAVRLNIMAFLIFLWRHQTHGRIVSENLLGGGVTDNLRKNKKLVVFKREMFVTFVYFYIFVLFRFHFRTGYFAIT